MVVQEKSFPRGGAVPGESVVSTKKVNLFDQKGKKKIKAKKKTAKHHVVTGAGPTLFKLEDLSYKVMAEGMSVLGQIKEITDYHLHISMPGLTVGIVPITQISEPYSQLLQSMSHSDDNIEALCPLSEIFYKGQLVTAQVWQIRKTADKRHVVTLTLDPRLVHSAWSHSAVAKKGIIITAAVKSKEEHGYVMDCGVNGLRSFLKDEKSTGYCEAFNGGRPLAIGQLVPCVVVKAETTSTASKIELSANPEDVNKREESGCQPVDLQHVLPGMRFQLTAAEPFRDGIKVKFFNNNGYIHRSHIAEKFSEKDSSVPNIPPGTILFGRVLYITPLVKNIYFSALPYISNIVKEIPKPSAAEVHFSIGDVVDSAKIIGVSGKGIFLRLGKKSLNVRGFVPERRIGFNYKGKVGEDDDEVTMLQRLRKKFPLGNSVRCRLIHLDTMSQTYVCSMEKSVLNEKYLTLSDVHVADVVPCIVDEIRDGGIIVKVGMLTGFVPATHSADVPLHQPVKRYPPGTRVSGRVLKVDVEKHRLIVTLKQALVSCQDLIISSYQSARKGICYLGTVVAISPKGVFVSFFGGVRGFLESNKFNAPDAQKFFVGQLLKCYVTRRNDKQIRLSLTPPDDFKQDKIACKSVYVGQCYKLEIVSVGSDCLKVKIIDEGECFNATGIIPSSHLSDDPRLPSLLLDTFEIGTILTNVWCYSNMGPKHPIVFSMRSSVTQFFKSIEGKIANKKTLEAVCPGWILPCTVMKVESNHLMLQVPLAPMTTLVKVGADSVCENHESISSLGFFEGQGIQAKVLKVLPDKNSLVLGCKRSRLWNGELETCVLHLSKYLSDQQRLLRNAKKIGDPLGAYLVGDEITGVVTEKTDWGFVFCLSNGARGEASFYNSGTHQLEIGMKIKGKVLFVDCLRRHVEITLRKDISNLKCNSGPQGGPSIDPDVQLRGPTLLVTPEFVLVQLKGSGKNNLGYIPTHLYPFANSKLTISEPFFGIDRKVIVKRCNDGIIICLSKEIIAQQRKDLKKKKKIEERKMKRAVKKDNRYFSECIASEEIKQEEEVSDEESDDSDEQLQVSRRVLDPNNDVQIIDDDMDDISDDESLIVDHDDGEDESDPEIVPPEEPRKRKLSNSESNKLEDFSDSTSFKIRKSKSSVGSDVPDNSSSPQMNNHKEQVSGDLPVNKKKRKRENNPEPLESTSEIETKKEKKTKNKEGKHGSASSVGIEVSNGVKDSDNEPKPTLTNPGFLWDIDPVKFTQVLEHSKNESSSDEDSDEGADQSKKKKRKKSAVERREAARLEEERLQRVEKELLDPNRQLNSCDDFDRMVLATPDSSAIWLQYMAFHLQATEIEKARAVAQKAIKTISFREEQEKLNVWLGLLNLENLYGTAESLKTTLDQALQSNEPYKIRAHMVRMYAESGKTKELDNEVRFVVKKFKETPGMWQEIGCILVNHGYAEKARSLLQQALPHMKNKKESVALVVQFALMEARNNNIEQAKALMDPILVSYPQRVDVWCVYCDMLVKANQINEARELLERSVRQKLPARKMKTLFTKFLQFEEAHGSKEGQDKVRTMASDFVKQVAGSETVEEL